MKLKTLYLMCGPAGSGKSTWAKEFAAGWRVLSKSIEVISRDEIRFSLLGDSTDYFSKENEVFDTFIAKIQHSIDKNEITIVDATHLTEKARNSLLDKLTFNEDLAIIPVALCFPLETCLNQNALRTGLARVPETVIKRMYDQFVIPTHNEKYEYVDILIVGDE